MPRFMNWEWTSSASSQQRGAFGRFDQPGNNRIHGRIAPLLRRHRQARIAVFG
jgi:hypothetical protein